MATDGRPDPTSLFSPSLIMNNPPLDAGINNKARRTISHSSGDLRRSIRLPCMPVLGFVKLPSLRRSEPGNTPNTTHKNPLLTFHLSSRSFLDTTLKDDSAVFPLYTIRTLGVTTTIVRADPWEANIKTADIRWPKIMPAKSKGKNPPDGVLVRLKGSRWKGGDSFLQHSASKNGVRKFSLPYYSHSMKWQKQGMAYWCTSSPVKGPIAVFDPPVDHLPGRLTVYETLHDKYETSPMLVHKGVSIFLLDYLLVTAILLVTEPQEWMLVQSSCSSITPNIDHQANGNLQWRKIGRGEPFFPRSPSPTTQYSTVDGFDDTPATSSSQERTAGIEHGESVFSQVQPELRSVLSFSSHSDEDSLSEITRSRSPSPLPESSLDPLSNTITAPHPYADPSLFSDQEVLPVSPLSRHYSCRASSDSAASTRSQLTREPPALSQPPVALASSSSTTNFRSPSSSNPQQQRSRAETSASVDAAGPADSSLWRRRPSEPIIPRARSTSRPLPRTPAGTHPPVIRRVQSQNRIRQVGVENTSPPPLPPIPSATTSGRPRRGGTLPPTPFDLAVGRSTGGINAPVVPDLQLSPKSFDSEVRSRWAQLLGGEQEPGSAPPRLSFDQPPPPYSSINFNSTNPQEGPRGN